MADTLIRAKARTLKDYARHDAGCASLPHYDDWGMIAIEPCSCGLDALLREADPGRIAVEDLADALQDRIVPASGRLLSAKPVKADPPAGECVKCGARYDYPQLGSTCINTAVVDGKLAVCGGRIAASPTLSEADKRKFFRIDSLEREPDPDFLSASPTLSEPEQEEGRICPQDGATCWGPCDVAHCEELAAQPEEEQYGQDTHHKGRRAEDSEGARISHDSNGEQRRAEQDRGGAASQEHTGSDTQRLAAASDVALPVRQRIEQAGWRGHNNGPDASTPMNNAIMAAAREALIILLERIDEAYKEEQEGLALVQYLDGLERAERLANELLSSITDQETTK